MQIRYFAALVASSTLSLAAPAPGPNPVSTSENALARRGCLAHMDNALADAIKARSFEKIVAALEGHTTAEINMDLATIFMTRTADEVEADIVAAFKGHVKPLPKTSDSSQEKTNIANELTDLSKDQKSNTENPGHNIETRQLTVYGPCGAAPFYGYQGLGCGIPSLLYALNGYRPGLLSTVGFIVDSVGAGLDNLLGTNILGQILK